MTYKNQLFFKEETLNEAKNFATNAKNFYFKLFNFQNSGEKSFIILIQLDFFIEEKKCKKNVFIEKF